MRERELCGMDLEVKFTIKRHFLKIIFGVCVAKIQCS